MDWNSSPTKNRSASGPATASTIAHCSSFVSWNSSTITSANRPAGPRGRRRAPSAGAAPRAGGRRSRGGRGPLAARVLERERLQELVQQRPQALEHGVAGGALEVGQRGVVVARRLQPAARGVVGSAASTAASGGCSSSSASAGARARDSSRRTPGPKSSRGRAASRARSIASSRLPPGAGSNRSGWPAVRSRSWVPSISVRSRSSPYAVTGRACPRGCASSRSVLS